MRRRYCFFAERQVGIGSAAAAIEPHLRNLPGAHWVDVTYSKAGGLVERLPLPGRAGGTLRGFLQVRAGLQASDHDALFFLTHNPAVFQQRALRRKPAVLWTDVTPELLDSQADQYDHPVESSSLLRQVKRELVTRTFRRAALCVGWSDWARRSFVADYGVPEARTRVVPPGVDLQRFAFDERPKPEGLPRLLFVGGNFKRKGGDLLLDVFRAELRGRCELDLVTRDDVPEEPSVRVHRGLNADSPELRALYRDATMFVLPTRGDCFSIASLEAMAVGLPVVVSAVGGIPEIVEPGKSGQLLAPGDGRDLARAIEPILANPALAREMGSHGRRAVEQRFDAKSTAARLVELLDSVA